MADLPDNVDPGGTYMLSGAFINSLLDWCRENEFKVTEDCGLRIDEEGPDGKVLNTNTQDIDVCVDGQTQTITFVTVQGT